MLTVVFGLSLSMLKFLFILKGFRWYTILCVCIYQMLLPFFQAFDLLVFIIMLWCSVCIWSWYRDRRDAKRRHPGDENYDSRTLYLPPDFLRSLSDGQVITAKVIGRNSQIFNAACN